MDLQRAVRDFVSVGKDLYQQLRTSGETLSDLDLLALREQLHMLDIEAGNLQEQMDRRADGIPFLFGGSRPSHGRSLSRSHRS